MITSKFRPVAYVVALGLAASVLTGCNSIEGLLKGEDDVFTLAVGDCINDGGEAEEVTTVPIVDCDEPHDREIYGALEMEDGEFPGEEAIQAQIEETCSSLFESFVGLPYDDSTLYYSSFYPTPDSWAGGDHEILCTISKVENEEIVQVTGTLRDAKE